MNTSREIDSITELIKWQSQFITEQQRAISRLKTYWHDLTSDYLRRHGGIKKVREWQKKFNEEQELYKKKPYYQEPDYAPVTKDEMSGKNGGRNYNTLRKILEKEIGTKYTNEMSDAEMKVLGDFLIDCTQSCSL